MKDINYYKFVNELAKILIDFCDDFDNAMKANVSEYKDDKWFSTRGDAFENKLNAILLDSSYTNFHHGEFATTFISLSDIFYDGKKAYFVKKTDEDGTSYYVRRSDKVAKEGKLHDAIIAARDLIVNSLKEAGDDYIVDASKNSKGLKLETDIEVYHFYALKSIVDTMTSFTTSFYLADETLSIAHKYQYLFEQALINGEKYIVRDAENNMVCNKCITYEHIPYYHFVTVDTKEEIEAYKDRSYTKSDQYAICILEDTTKKNETISVEIDEVAISEAMEKNKKPVTSGIKSFFAKLFKSKK